MIATAFAWIAGNRWSLVVAGFVVMCALLAEANLRAAGARFDAAGARQALAQAKAEAETAARMQSEAYRAEEQRRAMRQREIADEAEKRIAAAQSDAAAAGAAADQLRGRVASVVAAGRRAACNPAAPASRPAGTDGDDAIGMLARVFERADGVAGELASALDRSRLAGRICEASYDSLRD